MGIFEMIKFCKYERCCDGIISTLYSYEQVKKLKEDWYSIMREYNRSDAIEKVGMKDDAFESFKKEVEDFLLKCESENS